jgi:hypothetical protein
MFQVVELNNERYLQNLFVSYFHHGRSVRLYRFRTHVYSETFSYVSLNARVLFKCADRLRSAVTEINRS